MRKDIYFVFVQLLAVVIFMQLFKGESGSSPGFILNFAFYFLIFILPVIFYIRYIMRIDPLKFLRLKGNVLKGIVTGSVIGLILYIIYAVRHYLFPGTDGAGGVFSFGLILAGLFEEIVFRGFYLRVFKKNFGFVKANIISSFLFSLLHLKYLLSGDILQIIMMFVISLWLGYLYEKTNSLYPPMIVHAVFNIASVM